MPRTEWTMDPLNCNHHQSSDLVINRTLTQFTRTFSDLQPYSYLLLLPLLLTPIIETLKLVGRHRKRKPEPWINAPIEPQNTRSPAPAQAEPNRSVDTSSPTSP